MPVIMDADRMTRTITRIGHEIVERNRGTDDVALVGIRTRGVVIAQRLAQVLQQITHAPVRTGALDITLYRDDGTSRAAVDTLRQPMPVFAGPEAPALLVARV